MKVRQSNMELLRIVAMFMVMMFHCNFHTLGMPSFNEVVTHPLDNFMFFVVQAISVMCVNVFVLLSGWFGIHPTIKGGSKFIFQILFFMLGSYAAALLMGRTTFGIGQLAHCFFLDKSGWFIKAYLCLYILAPVLNSYAETAERISFRNLLVAFFCFQSLFGWVTDAAEFIHYGFSTISFIGLYLLARYIRRFSPSWSNKTWKFDMGIYASLVIVSALICVALGFLPMLRESLYHSALGHMYAYTSPVVILVCVFILLFFSKLKIQSKAINFVAASAFAVILVHGNQYIFTYTERVLNAYGTYCYWGALGYVIAMNLGVFVLAILLDQIRLFSWNLIERISEKINNK